MRALTIDPKLGRDGGMLTFGLDNRPSAERPVWAIRLAGGFREHRRHASLQEKANE